jgi:hypothetical protein
MEPKESVRWACRVTDPREKSKMSFDSQARRNAGVAVSQSTMTTIVMLARSAFS